MVSGVGAAGAGEEGWTTGPGTTAPRDCGVTAATFGLPDTGPCTNSGAAGPATPATISVAVAVAATTPDAARDPSWESFHHNDAMNGNVPTRPPMAATGQMRPIEVARKARTT